MENVAQQSCQPWPQNIESGFFLARPDPARPKIMPKHMIMKVQKLIFLKYLICTYIFVKKIY
jgi:hypothetical protein